MSIVVQILAGVSVVLGAFFVFLPKRREHFAEVLTVSILALVVCSGFRTLSSLNPAVAVATPGSAVSSSLVATAQR